MALMEYCLVNIVLGDSDPLPSKKHPPKIEKFFDVATKNGKRGSKTVENIEQPVNVFQRQVCLRKRAQFEFTISYFACF